MTSIPENGRFPAPGDRGPQRNALHPPLPPGHDEIIVSYQPSDAAAALPNSAAQPRTLSIPYLQGTTLSAPLIAERALEQIRSQAAAPISKEQAQANVETDFPGIPPERLPTDAVPGASILGHEVAVTLAPSAWEIAPLPDPDEPHDYVLAPVADPPAIEKPEPLPPPSPMPEPSLLSSSSDPLLSSSPLPEASLSLGNDSPKDARAH